MRIAIIVPDQTVIVDGIGRKVQADWSQFAPVHAVQADLAHDRAEVEFAVVDPDDDGPLPAIKPENKLISGSDFNAQFGVLVEAYRAVPETPKPEPVASEPKPPREVALPASLLERLAALEEKLLEVDQRSKATIEAIKSGAQQ